MFHYKVVFIFFLLFISVNEYVIIDPSSFFERSQNRISNFYYCHWEKLDASNVSSPYTLRYMTFMDAYNLMTASEAQLKLQPDFKEIPDDTECGNTRECSYLKYDPTVPENVNFYRAINPNNPREFVSYPLTHHNKAWKYICLGYLFSVYSDNFQIQEHTTKMFPLTIITTSLKNEFNTRRYKYLSFLKYDNAYQYRLPVLLFNITPQLVHCAILTGIFSPYPIIDSTQFLDLSKTAYYKITASETIGSAISTGPFDEVSISVNFIPKDEDDTNETKIILTNLNLLQQKMQIFLANEDQRINNSLSVPSSPPVNPCTFVYFSNTVIDPFAMAFNDGKRSSCVENEYIIENIFSHAYMYTITMINDELMYFAMAPNYYAYYSNKNMMYSKERSDTEYEITHSALRANWVCFWVDTSRSKVVLRYLLFKLGKVYFSFAQDKLEISLTVLSKHSWDFELAGTQTRELSIGWNYLCIVNSFQEVSPNHYAYNIDIAIDNTLAIAQHENISTMISNAKVYSNNKKLDVQKITLTLSGDADSRIMHYSSFSYDTPPNFLASDELIKYFLSFRYSYPSSSSMSIYFDSLNYEDYSKNILQQWEFEKRDRRYVDILKTNSGFFSIFAPGYPKFIFAKQRPLSTYSVYIQFVNEFLNILQRNRTRAIKPMVILEYTQPLTFSSYKSAMEINPLVLKLYQFDNIPVSVYKLVIKLKLEGIILSEIIFPYDITNYSLARMPGLIESYAVSSTINYHNFYVKPYFDPLMLDSHNISENGFGYQFFAHVTMTIPKDQKELFQFKVVVGLPEGLLIDKDHLNQITHSCAQYSFKLSAHCENANKIHVSLSLIETISNESEIASESSLPTCNFYFPIKIISDELIDITHTFPVKFSFSIEKSPSVEELYMTLVPFTAYQVTLSDTFIVEGGDSVMMYVFNSHTTSLAYNPVIRFTTLNSGEIIESFPSIKLIKKSLRMIIYEIKLYKLLDKTVSIAYFIDAVYDDSLESLDEMVINLTLEKIDIDINFNKSSQKNSLYVDMITTNSLYHYKLLQTSCSSSLFSVDDFSGNLQFESGSSVLFSSEYWTTRINPYQAVPEGSTTRFSQKCDLSRRTIYPTYTGKIIPLFEGLIKPNLLVSDQCSELFDAIIYMRSNLRYSWGGTILGKGNMVLSVFEFDFQFLFNPQCHENLNQILVQTSISSANIINTTHIKSLSFYRQTTLESFKLLLSKETAITFSYEAISTDLLEGSPITTSSGVSCKLFYILHDSDKYITINIRYAVTTAFLVENKHDSSLCVFKLESGNVKVYSIAYHDCFKVVIAVSEALLESIGDVFRLSLSLKHFDPSNDKALDICFLINKKPEMQLKLYDNNNEPRVYYAYDMEISGIKAATETVSVNCFSNLRYSNTVLVPAVVRNYASLSTQANASDTHTSFSFYKPDDVSYPTYESVVTCVLCDTFSQCSRYENFSLNILTYTNTPPSFSIEMIPHLPKFDTMITVSLTQLLIETDSATLEGEYHLLSASSNQVLTSNIFFPKKTFYGTLKSNSVNNEELSFIVPITAEFTEQFLKIKISLTLCDAVSACYTAIAYSDPIENPNYFTGTSFTFTVQPPSDRSLNGKFTISIEKLFDESNSGESVGLGIDVAYCEETLSSQYSPSIKKLDRINVNKSSFVHSGYLPNISNLVKEFYKIKVKVTVCFYVIGCIEKEDTTLIGIKNPNFIFPKFSLSISPIPKKLGEMTAFILDNISAMAGDLQYKCEYSIIKPQSNLKVKQSFNEVTTAFSNKIEFPVQIISEPVITLYQEYYDLQYSCTLTDAIGNSANESAYVKSLGNDNCFKPIFNIKLLPDPAGSLTLSMVYHLSLTDVIAVPGPANLSCWYSYRYFGSDVPYSQPVDITQHFFTVVSTEKTSVDFKSFAIQERVSPKFQFYDINTECIFKDSNRKETKGSILFKVENLQYTPIEFAFTVKPSTLKKLNENYILSFSNVEVVESQIISIACNYQLFENTMRLPVGEKISIPTECSNANQIPVFTFVMPALQQCTKRYYRSIVDCTVYCNEKKLGKSVEMKYIENPFYKDLVLDYDISPNNGYLDYDKFIISFSKIQAVPGEIKIACDLELQDDKGETDTEAGIIGTSTAYFDISQQEITVNPIAFYAKGDETIPKLMELYKALITCSVTDASGRSAKSQVKTVYPLKNPHFLDYELVHIPHNDSAPQLGSTFQLEIISIKAYALNLVECFSQTAPSKSQTYGEKKKIYSSSESKSTYTISFQFDKVEDTINEIYQGIYSCTLCSQSPDKKTTCKEHASASHISLLNPNYIQDDDISKVKSYTFSEVEKVVKEFQQTPISKQRDILTKNIDMLDNMTTKANNTDIMMHSILATSMIHSTHCEDTGDTWASCKNDLKIMQEKVVDKVTEIVNCESIFSAVTNSGNIETQLDLSTKTLYYVTLSSFQFTNSSAYKVANGTSCLIKETPKLLVSLSNETMNENTKGNLSASTESFLESLTDISSNLINMTKNSLSELKMNSSANESMYEEVHNDSLLVTPVTLKVKEIIEANALLVFKYSNSTEMESENIKYVYHSFNGKLRRAEENASTTEDCLMMKNGNDSVRVFYSAAVNQQNNISAVGVMLYNKYPLHMSNSNFSDQVVSLTYFDSNFNTVSVSNPNATTKVMLKKTEANFTKCVHFDTSTNSWSPNACKSQEMSDYILCDCHHSVKEITLWKYSPINIINDISHIFEDLRVINSFEPFKELSFDNAIAIYIFAGILFVYLIGLFFTILYDLKDNQDFFLFFVDEKESDCCSNDEAIQTIMEVKQLSDIPIIQHRASGVKSYFEELVKTSEGKAKLIQIVNDLGKLSLLEKELAKVLPVKHFEDTKNKRRRSEYPQSGKKEIQQSIEMQMMDGKDWNKLEEDEENSRGVERSHRRGLTFRRMPTHVNPEDVKLENDRVIMSDTFELKYVSLVDRLTTLANMHFRLELLSSNKGEGNSVLMKKNSFKECRNLEDILPKEAVKSSQTCCGRTVELFLKLKALIFHFFKTEYRLCLLLIPQQSLFTKTNVLTLIIFRLYASLTICTMLSPSSSKSGSETETSQGYKFVNRQFATVIIIILLTEIPFCFFELCLSKSKTKEMYSSGRKKNERIQAMLLVILTYIVFVATIIFGCLNTTFISLLNYQENRNLPYINDFLTTTLADYFIYEVAIMTTKSLIYCLIIKTTEITWWKQCLISFISVLPWAFSTFG